MCAGSASAAGAAGVATATAGITNNAASAAGSTAGEREHVSLCLLIPVILHSKRFIRMTARHRLLIHHPRDIQWHLDAHMFLFLNLTSLRIWFATSSLCVAQNLAVVAGASIC